MNCTGKGCNGDCRQGRDCRGSRMATRRVMGLAQDEGDQSPANARGWTKWVVIVLFAALAVVEMCLGAWGR